MKTKHDKKKQGGLAYMKTEPMRALFFAYMNVRPFFLLITASLKLSNERFFERRFGYFLANKRDFKSSYFAL